MAHSPLACVIPAVIAPSVRFRPSSPPHWCPGACKALGGYLGEDRKAWRKHDAVALIDDGARVSDLLVDVGDADQFLTTQLRPELLEQACAKANIPADAAPPAGL